MFIVRVGAVTSELISLVHYIRIPKEIFFTVPLVCGVKSFIHRLFNDLKASAVFTKLTYGFYFLYMSYLGV